MSDSQKCQQLLLKIEDKIIKVAEKLNSYNLLVKKFEENFPILIENHNSIYYVDEESENITISNDQDLETMYISTQLDEIIISIFQPKFVKKPVEQSSNQQQIPDSKQQQVPLAHQQLQIKSSQTFQQQANVLNENLQKQQKNPEVNEQMKQPEQSKEKSNEPSQPINISEEVKMQNNSQKLEQKQEVQQQSQPELQQQLQQQVEAQKINESSNMQSQAASFQSLTSQQIGEICSKMIEQKFTGYIEKLPQYIDTLVVQSQLKEAKFKVEDNNKCNISQILALAAQSLEGLFSTRERFLDFKDFKKSYKKITKQLKRELKSFKIQCKQDIIKKQKLRSEVQIEKMQDQSQQNKLQEINQAKQGKAEVQLGAIQQQGPKNNAVQKKDEFVTCEPKNWENSNLKSNNQMQYQLPASQKENEADKNSSIEGMNLWKDLGYKNNKDPSSDNHQKQELQNDVQKAKSWDSSNLQKQQQQIGMKEEQKNQIENIKKSSRYSEIVIQKARKIWEILGNQEDMYYDIVEKNVNLSINDIIEKYVLEQDKKKD